MDSFSLRCQSLSANRGKRKLHWLLDPKDSASGSASKRLRNEDFALPDLLSENSFRALTALCSLADGRMEEAMIPSSIDDFESRFERSSRVLGSGQFGTVTECMERLTGKRFACKVMRSGNSAASPGLPTRIEEVRKEAAIMRKLAGHEGILGVEGLYEGERELLLVLELCDGGDLFDETLRRGRFDEPDAASVFAKLTSAVAFAHSHGVFHRDLKPENILLARSESGSLAPKLADFGLALELHDDDKLLGMAGSPFYMAPEVVDGEYDKRADVWSLGVILYILLSGSPPFWGETDSEVFGAIRKGVLDVSEEPWGTVSLQAKSLVCSLLRQNPEERPSLQEVLAHPWLQGQAEALRCSSSQPQPMTSESMMARAFGSILA